MSNSLSINNDFLVLDYNELTNVAGGTAWGKFFGVVAVVGGCACVAAGALTSETGVGVLGMIGGTCCIATGLYMIGSN